MALPTSRPLTIEIAFDERSNFGFGPRKRQEVGS
jgi:hypothetical protein